MVLVDSNVILDVATPDPRWAHRSVSPCSPVMTGVIARRFQVWS